MNFFRICRLCGLSVLSLLGMLAGPAGAAPVETPFTPNDFSLRHPLIPAEQGDAFKEGALYRISLPADVLLELQRPDFGDLCIFNAENVPVLRGLARPDAPRQQKTHAIVQLYPLWGAPNEKADTVRLSIDITTDGNERPPKLALEQPGGKVLKGYIAVLPESGLSFERLSFIWDKGQSDTVRFSLQTGDDLVSWRPVSDHETLVRLEGTQDVLENSTVLLNERRTGRYLRLLFDSGLTPAAIQRIDATEFSTGDVTRAFEPTLSATPLPRTPSVLEYRLNDTSPGGLPLTSLMFTPASPGQYIHVRVLTRFGDQEAWRLRGNLTLFSLLRKETLVRNAPFALPGDPVNRIRLERVDGQPFTDSVLLNVRYRPVDLYFLAQGKAPYTLAWSSPRFASGGSADIQSLLKLNGASVATAVLDPVSPLLPPPEPPPAASPAEAAPAAWKEMILWGILGVGVLLLGFMAWRLSRTMRGK